MKYGMPLLPLIWLWAASAGATGPRMAVLPFTNATNDPAYHALAAAMPDLLTACLTRENTPVVVVERRAWNALSAEHAERGRGYMQGGRKFTRLLGADVLLTGSLTRASPEDGRLTLELQRFNAATTVLEGHARIPWCAGCRVAALCPSIAATALFTPPTARFPSAAAALSPEEAEFTALWMRGLGHYHTGRYAEAVSAFLTLYRRYPDRPAVQLWLARSLEAAGMGIAAVPVWKALATRYAGTSEGDAARRMLQKHEEILP